jgi:hypothetical protein
MYRQSHNNRGKFGKVRNIYSMELDFGYDLVAVRSDRGGLETGSARLD